MESLLYSLYIYRLCLSNIHKSSSLQSGNVVFMEEGALGSVLFYLR